jgi:hypothetical protein
MNSASHVTADLERRRYANLAEHSPDNSTYELWDKQTILQKIPALARKPSMYSEHDHISASLQVIVTALAIDDVPCSGKIIAKVRILTHGPPISRSALLLLHISRLRK